MSIAANWWRNIIVVLENTFDPSRRREGVCTSETSVDDSAAGNQNGSAPGRDHGDGDPSFLERAANKVSDASTRQLLGNLAEAERKHMTLAENFNRNT
jgi:hypothetical protein